MEIVLKKSWRALALRGIVAIIFGLLLLFVPGLTLATGGLSFVILFSVYALVAGISTIVSSVRRREGHWVLMLLLGIVEVIAGLYALSHPALVVVLTLATMVYIIAFMALVGGIIEIVGAWRLRQEIDNEWLLALNGFFSVIFGLLLLLRPIQSLEILILITSLYLLMAGAMQIVLAYKVRQWVAKN